MFARRSTSLISTLSRSSFPLPRPQHVSFSTLGPKQATSFNFAPKSHMKHVILCGTLLAMGYATQRYCETEQKQDKPIIGGNKFHFNHGAAVYPHPDKEYKGGEDAYFVSESGLVMGVADGVGGWASKGVDPAIYARALMEGARKYANTHMNVFDPILVMEAGYHTASAHLGSSTCCIVALEGSILNSANLGDSGFMVIRDDKVVYRTKEQQHRFNFPFQLGNTSRDKPQHSDLNKFSVIKGDIVILGTDGLFDNLYDSQILSCVVANKKNQQPQLLSEAIAKFARIEAARTNGRSPFADGSTAFGRPRQGGKMDDITVVVGIVA